MPRRTKLIIAGTVTLFITLVATLTLLYVNIWSPPTKQDFEQAKAGVRTLEAQYDDLSVALRLYSSSIQSAKPDGSKDAKAGYQKAVNAIDASFKKLGESKSVRDADVKDGYDALVKKQDEIRSYADGSILYKESLVRCVDVFVVMRESSDAKKIAAAHGKAANDCLPLLDQLKRSKVSYFADFAKGYAGAIRKRQVVFDDSAAKKISQTELDSQISEIYETDLKRVMGNEGEFVKAQTNASAYTSLQRLNKVIDQKIKQS